MCVTINKCWFKDEPNKIPQAQNYDAQAKLNYILSGKTVGLYHYGCHCKKTEIFPRDINDINLIIPQGKIDWLLNDKGDWIKTLGYDLNQEFVNTLSECILKHYFYGDYVIENHTKYGVRIKINFTLPGSKEKILKLYKLKASFMVFPHGTIKCNTLIGGWQH